jgi:hypothetical protein
MTKIKVTTPTGEARIRQLRERIEVCSHWLIQERLDAQGRISLQEQIAQCRAEIARLEAETGQPDPRG